MQWQSLLDEQCSVARSSAVIGDRWSLVLLSELFLGVRRFDDFKARLDISRTTLTARLKHLEQHEVVRKVAYQSNPPRYEYHLTRKGVDLFPVITTLVSWGDRYYADEGGPPILRRHLPCGHDIEPVLRCPECNEDIDPRDMKPHARADRPGQAPVRRGPFPSPA